MAKILVTGADGFVGRILCETLRSRSMMFVPAVRRAQHGSQVSVGDLSRADIDWGDALAGCDAVIHLAARVHMMNDSSSDPLTAFRAVNRDATLNLARQSVIKGVRRFVYVSSVKVNGEKTTDRPFTAFDVPAPVDFYAKSKHEAETALMALSKETGLEVVIVRPPLVYGPGVPANFLRLMQLTRSHVPLPLGAIHNRRSMIAADNLADLLLTCVLHPAAVGQTFMASDGRDVSVSELLRMLAGSMGKRSLLFPFPVKWITGLAALFGKSAIADRLVESLQVDIAHTQSTMQWSPKVGFENSLKKTVDYFVAHS